MRVVIVGGGIIGLCAAHYLDQAGFDVVVVDRGTTGSGCSGGNAGWICPSHCFSLATPGLPNTSLRWLLRSDSPLYFQPSKLLRLAPWLLEFRRNCNSSAFERATRALTTLARQSLDLFEELASEIEFERAQMGLLSVFSHAQQLDAKLELLHLTGYEHKTRRVEPDELATLEPCLRTGLAGGLLAEPEWHLSPEGLCRALAEDLLRRGVELIEGVEVLAARSEGRAVTALDTSQGPIEAATFVLCTGAEAGRLSQQLDFPLPLQAGKGYSITVERPRAKVRRPLHLVDARIAVTPLEGALRIAGTMEFSGINLQLNPKRLASLCRAAEREVPGVLEGAESRPWVGMRPITPDSLPVIGRLPTRENVFLATGHQMLGMTLAPPTGRALAQMLVAGEAATDMTPFDPARLG